MRTITGSLIACSAAAVFTVGALITNPQPPPLPALPATPTAPGAAPTLTVAGFRFSAVTAHPGEVVAVTNQDGDAHTVTSKDGAFDTGSIGAGGTATFTAPAQPGTYAFICNIHPFMKGELVVA
jgi:plastocyanin